MLRQEINLYLPEFRPQRDWLDTAHLLRAALLLLLLLGMLMAYNHWRLSQAEGRRLDAQQRFDQMSREAEALEREIALSDLSASVQRELDREESALAHSRDTLSFLQQLRLGNMSGFSAALADLSRASFDGIWLTGVAINDGGELLRLEGRANDAAMLPAYVSRLGQGESMLANKRFRRLSTAHSEGDAVYEFLLESH